MLYINSRLLKQFGKKVMKDTVLCREGDAGNCMYIIYSGKVAITKNCDGEEKLLVVLSDGDFFGEMALLNNEKRSATATCMSNVELLEINAQGFEYMLRKSPDVALRLVKGLSERIREMNQVLTILIHKDDATRVMLSLVKALKGGTKTKFGVRFRFDKDEISKKMNVDIEKISEIIQMAVKAQVIMCDKDFYIIPDEQKLGVFSKYIQQTKRD